MPAERRRFAAREIVEHYDLLFEPAMRAAHRACLEHAELTREDRWPSVQSCLDFGKLYGVPGAELAAFFGHLGYGMGSRVLWVDALRGGASPWTAQQLATDEQAKAFGFRCALLEAVSTGGLH
jgi:hypothetical protein